MYRVFSSLVVPRSQHNSSRGARVICVTLTAWPEGSGCRLLVDLVWPTWRTVSWPYQVLFSFW